MKTASLENPVFRVITDEGFVPFEEVEASVAGETMDVFPGGYHSAVKSAMDFLVDLHNNNNEAFFRVNVVMYNGEKCEDGSIKSQTVYKLSSYQAVKFGLISIA